MRRGGASRWKKIWKKSFIWFLSISSIELKMFSIDFIFYLSLSSARSSLVDLNHFKREDLFAFILDRVTELWVFHPFDFIEYEFIVSCRIVRRTKMFNISGSLQICAINFYSFSWRSPHCHWLFSICVVLPSLKQIERNIQQHWNRFVMFYGISIVCWTTDDSIFFSGKDPKSIKKSIFLRFRKFLDIFTYWNFYNVYRVLNRSEKIIRFY